ncbi:MAG: ParB/RepB/Spo0J family partition protein [Chloroflexi bacterium]|nr:ParB/RepB/Spo0J family partition protein [Chloroflexota bacterium]
MTETFERTSGLGRGLAALIPTRPGDPRTGAATEIAIARIERNPYQPRQRMGEAELEALAESIRVHGVIQPILVTETRDGFRLIAGERRVRAAEMAGLDRIPAVVRQAADREQLELALVENLQREDLGPIEAARAYRQLIDEFGLSQEEIAARVSRARSTVANTLRLLDLDPAVQAALDVGSISEGHGRALGGLLIEAQPAVLRAILERQLTVREAEELVRRLRAAREAADAGAASAPAAPAARDPEIERLEEDLRRALGTKVTLTPTRRGGRIVIDYFGDDELSRIYERLTGPRS